MAKKKPKKKKVGIPKSKIMSAVRRLWLYSDERKEALNRNVTEDGFHRCEICRALTEHYALDHKIPVVPLTGFDGYTEAFTRMFCPAEDLQKICDSCHGKKTAYEAGERKKNRALKKVVDKEDKE